MAIPWPSSPTVGQTFTYGSITYTWSGVAWINTVTNTPAVVGSVAVTAPITNSGTSTAPVIGINQSALAITESQVTGLVSDLAGKANLAGGNSFTETQTVTGSVTSTTPLVVKGASGQSADILQIQNSSGTVLAAISSIGVVRSGTFASLTTGLTGLYTNYDTSGIGIVPTSAAQKGLIVRGASSQSANLQEWQNSGGTILSRINSSGNFLTPSLVVSYDAQITSGGTAVVPTVIKGAVSQSADLTQWQNSGGTIIAKVGSTGDFTAGYTYISGLRDTAATGPYINTTATNVLLNARTATNKGLIIQGAASQSANLFEIQDSAGGTQVKINQVGNTTLYGNLTSVNNATFTPNTASVIPLTVKGAASQSVNLQEWQTSTPTTVASVSQTGLLTATGLSSSSGLTLTGANSPIVLPTVGAGTSGQVLTSAGTGATPTWTTVSGGTFTGGTLTSNLTLVAGNTSVYPLTFQTNAGTPTASAGTMDYDGIVFYNTPNTTTGRALTASPYLYVSSSAYGLDFSASAAAQSILGSTTKGITLLAGSTYEYEILASVQYQNFGDSTTTITHNFTSSVVTLSPTIAYTQTIEYGNNTTSFATATTMSLVRSTSATGVAIGPVTTTGSRYITYKVRGTIRVTGTGSIKVYPSLTASAITANTVTVQTGAFFKLTPIGNGTVTTIGAWA